MNNLSIIRIIVAISIVAVISYKIVFKKEKTLASFLEELIIGKTSDNKPYAHKSRSDTIGPIGTFGMS